MKKCPMCGNDVNDEIKYCYNCGYDFNGKNKGVFYKTNSDISGIFLKKQDNSVGKTIFFVVLSLIFGFPLIMFMVFFFAFSIDNKFNDDYDYDYNYDYDYEYDEDYVCNKLCGLGHVSFDNKCICENGDIYSENNGTLYYKSDGSSLDNYYRCNIFCYGEPVDYDNEECTCSNGQKVDRYGEYFYDISADIEKVISNWENEVSSGDFVTTVFCDTAVESMCSTYKNIVDLVKQENNIKIFYFNLNGMPSNQRYSLIYKYNIDFYNNYPYTFIMKDGKLVNSVNGMMYGQALKNFLSENGVI